MPWLVPCRRAPLLAHDTSYFAASARMVSLAVSDIAHYTGWLRISGCTLKPDNRMHECANGCFSVQGTDATAGRGQANFSVDASDGDERASGSRSSGSYALVTMPAR